MITPISSSVFVGSYLPYSETFVYDQLMNQQKFKSTVYSYEVVPTAERFPYDQVVGLGAIERSIYKSFGRSPTFMKSMKEAETQLIHAHFGTNGVYASHFAKKLKKPLAVTFHGHDVPGLFPENKYTSRYYRYQKYAHSMFDVASLYLCCSNEIADIALNRFNIPQDKIELHLLGIDLDRFQLIQRPERAVRILTIGRFVEKKGFIYVLEALSAISSQFPEVELTMVGDGPLKSEYQTFIREKNLEGKVHFAGTMTSSELQELMSQHDILMAPSVVSANGDRESGLIVLKEAAASGMPTIGTYHGGLPEIIQHEETGFLAPERDSKALSQFLTELLSSYELRQSMGLKARSKMEREYDTIKQNAKLEDHFLSLL